MKFDMNKKIVTLVNSLREGTAGKTCMGTGNYSFDIITRREYPDGFVVGNLWQRDDHVALSGCEDFPRG